MNQESEIRIEVDIEDDVYYLYFVVFVMGRVYVKSYPCETKRDIVGLKQRFVDYCYNNVTEIMNGIPLKFKNKETFKTEFLRITQSMPCDGTYILRNDLPD